MRIVAGKWGGRRLQAPLGRGTRPTTDRAREARMSAVFDQFGGPLDVAFKLEENHYNGRTSIQAKLVDVRAAE